MDRSNNFFRERNFKKAEPLLVEAYAIFHKEFGPDHQNTRAALQNLSVIRNNIILELWEEIANEEIAKIKEDKNQFTDQDKTGGDGLDSLSSLLRGSSI